jgi:hypothetical protein
VKKIPPALALFVIMLPVLINSVTQVKYWDCTINADGYGYYAYLPCVFIYHQLNYQKVMAEEHKLRPDLPMDEIKYPFIPLNDTRTTDKYFIGVSILLVPFFLLAYFLSYLCGYDLNGYSPIFQESVALGALFYLVIGLIYLRKLMLEFQIPEKIIFFTLLVTLYGTNLFYYSVYEPSLSHVYSFGLQAAFLYFARKSIQAPQIKNLLPAAILSGLLFVTRPTNILSFAAIPFLAGNIKNLKIFLSGLVNLKKISVLLLSVFIIISIQFIKWHIETGEWYVWGYTGDKLIFSNPHIIDILFSYRKGWFLYTPLMLLIISGSALMFLYSQKIFQAISILFFFLSTVYVCSCWLDWWDGGGFGAREFIDYYAFYSLLLGLLIKEVKNIILKITVIILPLLCIALSIIQTIQYNKFIFSWGQMNKKRYWDVFLKTDSKYGWMYEGPSSKLSLFDSPILYQDFHSNFNSSPGLNGAPYKGLPSLLLSPAEGNILIYSLKCSDIPKSSGIWIYMDLWCNTKQMDNDGCFITQVKSPYGKIYFSNIHHLTDEMAGTDEWERVKYIYQVSTMPDDTIKVYAKCTNGFLSVDNITMRFGTQKHPVPTY